MLVQVMIDKEKDIRSFYDSIFGEEYIKKRGHIKNAIYRFYPRLAEGLEGIVIEQKRKQIIHDYVSGLYTQYSSKLSSIKDVMQTSFDEHINEIINCLCSTMDFEWDTLPMMSIYLTFKPNSTFWLQVINLSIALEIFKDQRKPYIDIFIHEMTHIIFNQKIWEIYKRIWFLWVLAHEDLKEIVAPVIMRDEIFHDMLESEHMRNANEKQQSLSISVDWSIYNIVDYFESIYDLMKAQWHDFWNILEEYVRIFLRIESQIEEKHAIYNTFGLSNANKEEYIHLLHTRWYFAPIVIR